MPAKKNTSNPTKRRGVALWIGLLFIASAWMFFLGIVVGRGTAPVKFDIENLKKELAELKEKVMRQELKRYKIHPEDGQNREGLDFHEALKNPTDETGLLMDPKHKSSIQWGDKPELQDRRTPDPKKTDETLAPPTDKPGASVPQASEKKWYAIQVLSVKDSKAADKIVLDLKKKGYSAYKKSGSVGGKGVYHRVRVGNFADKTSAEATLDRLRKEKYKPLLILLKEDP